MVGTLLHLLRKVPVAHILVPNPASHYTVDMPNAHLLMWLKPNSSQTKDIPITTDQTVPNSTGNLPNPTNQIYS
jgi:hypothetical protein